MKTLIEKYYTNDCITKQFSKLTRVNQIKTLYKALDYMEEYNGRTKILCIAMVLGYENFEGRVNTYTRK